MDADTTAPPRLLTPAEFGAVIKSFRTARRWTQQQLAEIAGISMRTLQRVERVERGQAADFDTKRALAAAFDLADIDVFNKPFAIPTADDLKRQQEAFERDHITLKSQPVQTGRQLATLAEACAADMCEPGGELPREAQEEFAALTDYIREYRDCHDLYTEVDRLDIFDEIQGHVDTLAQLKVSLRYATRKVAFKAPGAPAEAQPLRIDILYLIAYPAGDEPTEFATPRSFRFG